MEINTPGPFGLSSPQGVPKSALMQVRLRYAALLSPNGMYIFELRL